MIFSADAFASVAPEIISITEIIIPAICSALSAQGKFLPETIKLMSIITDEPESVRLWTASVTIAVEFDNIPAKSLKINNIIFKSMPAMLQTIPYERRTVGEE